MKLLRENDYQILEKLISLKQKSTKKTATKFLNHYYDKVIDNKDFVIAEGDIPVALVAHLDTVFEKDKRHKRNELFYDAKKGVLWNPYGAGFDDKAGVFAIFKIIQDGYRPHIIFTTDEEIGGIGAVKVVEKYENFPFNELKYIIELDRANESDCVFYDCINRNFIDYIESFGFIEAWGTFSDIDVLCPYWGVAGVNLSIGYKNEHTSSEILNINATFKTIQRVKNMLDKANDAPVFQYIQSHYNKYLYSIYGYDWYDEGVFCKCDKCGIELNNYETVPVKKIDGTSGLFCCDCIVDMNVEWCKRCDEAFERKPGSKEILCPDCKKELGI